MFPMAPFIDAQPWPGNGELWPRSSLCDVWATHSHISNAGRREPVRQHGQETLFKRIHEAAGTSNGDFDRVTREIEVGKWRLAMLTMV